MISIDEILSEELGTNPDSLAYADGPFVLIHNGQAGVGAWLQQIDDNMVVSAQTRVYEFDDEYTVDVSPDGANIKIDSSRYQSHFEIRPLTLEDNKWTYPEYVFKTVDQLRAFTAEQLRLLNDTTGAPVAVQYGVTLDDEGYILDLIKADKTGMFVRDKGQWIAIDTDSEEDSATIDGYDWVDVSEASIAFFDDNSTVDTLTRTDIEPFVVS